MAHPTDEALLALTHGELDRPAAELIRLHCAGCPDCARRAAAIRAEDGEVGRLLSVLDRPAPSMAAPAGSPVRAAGGHRRSAALAASLALLVVGAAAAAVPATPLTRWVRSRRDGAPPPAPRAAPPPVIAAPAPPSQAASGVELPLSRSLVVAFGVAEPDGVVTLRRSDRPDAALRAFGGGVAYQVGDGRISVDNRKPARRYALDVPAGVAELTVTVAGRTVFHSTAPSLPADSVLAISLANPPR